MTDRRAYNAEWRRNHKSQVDDYNRLWKHDNQKRVKRYQRDWVERHRAKVNEYNKRYRQKHPGAARRAMLKHKYGITVEAWNALFKKQERRCAICHNPRPGSERGWSTDHDHETNKVRGILCQPCNQLVGAAEHARMPMVQVYVARGGCVQRN